VLRIHFTDADLARTCVGELVPRAGYFPDSAVVPEWARVEEHVASDAASRAHAFHRGGVHRLLDSLRPTLRWDPPVLSADYPARYGVLDIHLDGRGLRLIPSYFCWRMPVTLVDPALPPTVVYPACRPEHRTPESAGALAAVLGRTRTHVLMALATPATTTELARRLRMTSSRPTSLVYCVALWRTLIRVMSRQATARTSVSSCASVNPFSNSPMTTRWRSETFRVETNHFSLAPR